MRIMGIDYGDSRVGIAMSDPLEITAQGIVTLPNKVYSRMLDSLFEIINQYDVKKIVLGMPKNMNGDSGDRVEITRAFSAALRLFIGMSVLQPFRPREYSILPTPEAKTEKM